VKGSKWSAAVGAAVLVLGFQAAARAQEEAPPATTVDASQGFVTFKSGDNSLTLGAWGQFRGVADDREVFDADTAGTGLGVEDGVTAAFSIPRLRFYIQGTVFKPWMKYKIEAELANLRTDATNNINNGRLTDAYVEFARSPYATVRAGQYKVPFGMQQVTSDTRQEFVDRSIADAKFAPARDVGVMLSGLFLDKKLGYQAAVFNGAGQNNPQDDRGFLYVGRIAYDPLGEYRLIEGAVDNPEKSTLHFALAYRLGEVPRGLSSVGTTTHVNNENALGFEFAWKLRRFYAMAEYFQQTDEQENPTVGPDIDADGFHAQFGVFVVPKKQELAVRYAQVQPDKDVDEAEQTEMRLVYGYFWKSHNMKLQADIGQIAYGENFAALSPLALRNVSPGLSAANRLIALPGEEIKDNQLRVQFLLAF
jgi:phosphate-selective porin